MSTDPKIDLFARDLFDALWNHHGLIIPSARVPPDELTKSEFNENVLRAVQVRQAMFHSAYATLFENTYAEFAGNSSYFSVAIADFFPHYVREEDPEEESVMCSFLSSCAFVATMCMMGNSRGDEDLLRSGREAWAMFADLHLKQAFYEAGGWGQLQFFARCEAVFDFVRTFSDVVDCRLGRNVMFHDAHLTCAAVNSFYEFEDWKGGEETAPYALEWVDFSVGVPFVKVRSPDHYAQPIPSVFDKLEVALWSLNYFCDPLDDDDVSDDDDEDDLVGSKTGLTGRHLNKILTGSDEETESGSDNETAWSSVGLDDKDHEEKESGIGNCKQVKRTPRHEQRGIKTANENSIPYYNKDASPADNPSSESREGTYGGFEGASSGSLPQGIPYRSPPPYVSSANDRGDTNTNPEDLDSIVDPSTQKKLSGSKSRVGVSVKTIDYDSTTLPVDESLGKTPNKPGLVSPIKSSFTSPSVNVSNTPDRPPLRRMNSTGSDGMKRKKSTGKENSPSHPLKTDIKKKNSPYKKHKSPNLGLETNAQKLEDKYTKRDSLSPDSCEKSISIHQSNPKFISLPRNLYSIYDETDRSKDVQVPTLPGEDTGEAETLFSSDEYVVKKFESTKWMKLVNKLNKQISIASSDHHDDEMIYKPTADQSKHILDQSLMISKPSRTNVQSRPPIEKEFELSDRRSSQDSCSTEIYDITKIENFYLKNQHEVVYGEQTNETSCLTEFRQTSSFSHQSSILTKEDEYYHIHEKPLKINKPTGKNDLSRPPIENEFESRDRRNSQDSASTEIYEIEESSADPTEDNQFQSGAKPKRFLNTKHYHGKLLANDGHKTPPGNLANKSPIGSNRKKETKKKSNSNDSNREPLQTTGNPVGLASNPQDMEKKRRKRKAKKRPLSRLEQRIKEEGDGVLDVTRLIFVMGHQPGMASVASAFHDSKKQIT